jgi:hypothetical protein
LGQIVKISTTARTDWSFATTLLAIAAVLLLLPFSGRAATLATAPMQLAQAAAPEAVPMLLDSTPSFQKHRSGSPSPRRCWRPTRSGHRCCISPRAMRGRCLAGAAGH